MRIDTDYGPVTIQAQSLTSAYAESESLVVNRVPIRVRAIYTVRNGPTAEREHTLLIERTDKLYPDSKEVSWNARGKVDEALTIAVTEAMADPVFRMEGERRKLEGQVSLADLHIARLREQLAEQLAERSALAGQLTSVRADIIEQERARA